MLLVSSKTSWFVLSPFSNRELNQDQHTIGLNFASVDFVFLHFPNRQNRRYVHIGRCGVIISKGDQDRQAVLYRGEGEVLTVIDMHIGYKVLLAYDCVQLIDEDSKIWRMRFDSLEDREEFKRLCEMKCRLFNHTLGRRLMSECLRKGMADWEASGIKLVIDDRKK